MSTWFSTDWHLGHKNIIRFDNRPFKSIEEHDSAIMKNIMSQLKPKDALYYLGDFTLSNKGHTESMLATLASSGAMLYFIKGNHDKDDTIKLYQKYGTYLGEQKKIVVEGQEIILNHFKMLVWDKAHHGSWHLYGHSHGSIESYIVGKSMDCAINLFNYKLIEFSEIKKLMDKREYLPLDHHRRERYEQQK